MHPLWPTLEQAQQQYVLLLAEIRGSVTSPQDGDAVRGMIGQARSIASECHSLAIRMIPELSEGEHLGRKDWKTGETLIPDVSIADEHQLLARRLADLDNLAKIEVQIRSKGRLQTVPWGGIRSHERQGQHLISEHVGKSIAELHEQLATKATHALYASTFPDIATADKAAAEVLSKCHREISTWLKSGTRKPLRPAYDCEFRVGYVLERNTHRYFPTSKIKLILVRNDKTLLGYQIKTGFPIP